MFRKLIFLVAGLALISAAACSNTPSTHVSTTAVTSISATAPTTAVGTTSFQVPATGVKQAGNLRIWMTTTPSPPRPGNAVLDAYVVDAEGQPINDAVLTFSINMTNMNMGNSSAQPPLVGDGHYSQTMRFSMAGPWRVTVTIVRGGQTSTAAFDFTVTY